MRCVACKLCVENCPSHCIFVEPEAYPDPSRGNYPKRYEIDIREIKADIKSLLEKLNK